MWYGGGPKSKPHTISLNRFKIGQLV